jgi:hypothetical protein
MKKMTRCTAIQLRNDDRLRCSIVYGKTARIIPGMIGKIALVDDGCLIGYHIQNGNRERAFLFRTDAIGGAQKISGIYPAVRLLVTTRSRFRVAHLLSFLDEFSTREPALDRYPDDCFNLLNTMLEGRGCGLGDIKKLMMQCLD